MSRLNLKITEQVKTDILSMVEYISKDNRAVACDILASLHDVCNELTDFHEIGTLREEFTYKDYRFFVVKKLFVIAYRVDGDDLFISRVLSGDQDICAIL